MIHHGDLFDVLPTLPESSIDACVTDPPYELGFMGKHWDRSGVAYRVETWQAVYRVLKPGAHLVAFGGTRTSHRMVCAIEDAGFEIRDALVWLYGQGFPKSLDISKALDKRRGDDDATARVAAWLRDRLAGKNRADIDAHFGSANIGQYWFSPQRNAQVPAWDKWLWLKEWLGFDNEMDAEVWRLNGRKGQPGEAWHEREVTGAQTKARSEAGKSALPTMGAGVKYETWNLTAPATDAAKQWDGWGTALKPAHEPIVLARKPLIGTVAANVMAHGTGGINIDACRIEGAVRNTIHGRSGGPHIGQLSTRPLSEFTPNDLGRWPANVLLDEEAAAMLDEQTGELTSGAVSLLAGDAFTGDWRASEGRTDPSVRATDYSLPGSSGGASRFFYVAKPSRAERDLGCYDLAASTGGESTDREEGSAGLNNPRAGAGRTGGARNIHPTVKPVELMRWLVRLVTPIGGTVLDPFTGSGTTGMACVLESRLFIGIEREAQYVEIARRRITETAPLFAGEAAS